MMRITADHSVPRAKRNGKGLHDLGTCATCHRYCAAIRMKMLYLKSIHMEANAPMARKMESFGIGCIRWIQVSLHSYSNFALVDI